MADDPLIDPLIDEVASAMTAAPSDGRLAQRVAARLEERSPSFLGAWAPAALTGSLYTAAAAVCVVLIAVFVMREKPRGVRRTERVGDLAIAATANREPGTANREPRAESPEPRSTARVITPRELPEPTLDPIVVNRLDVQPLVEMGEIEISPIAIDRIEIAAMP